MRFRLLGGLEVRADDGAVIEVAAPKRRALLAALLLNANRPVSADRLSEALWGETPPPAAAASLQAHISRLRREVGVDRIVSSPAGYALVVGEGELDTASFERHVDRGRQLAVDGCWAEAAQELREGLDLWRGPALAEFAAEEFAWPEIARLDDLRVSSIEARVEADLATGQHARLTAELETLVGQHPLRERLRGQQMLALYRSGRQADALAAYRRLRSTLVEELGIDPSPELQELEVRILRQDPSLAGPTAGPTQPAIRLPLGLTSIVGRQSELDQAVGILRRHRLLTLTGPGGVGKTRLGILVAHAMIEESPDGVLFVDLSAERDPARVPARIGGVTGGGDRPDEVIGRRRMLLILDNFEQVLDASPEVSNLLAACPALRVLVTSRAPLRIAGERQLEVPPLADSDAAALFEDRSRAAALSIGLGAGVVDDIVARLDGLPLAIELAAARVRLLAPESLRERLVERLATLSAGPRDAPRRHRTLRETIAWSYDLLSADGKAGFRRLSVLAPGFDLAAATAVGRIDLDGLGELVDQSLVRRVDGRYAMLETIREFAAEGAQEHGETDTARDDHLRHYVAVATSVTRATTAVDGSGRNAWLAMCESERENLRLAFDWAVSRADDDSIVRLYRSLGMYLLIVGSVDEGLRWGELAVEAATRLGSEPRRMTALMTLSEFPRYSGDPALALTLKLQAMDLARSLGDWDALTTLDDDVASIHAVMGDFARARARLDEAMALHDEHPSAEPLDRVHTLVTLTEIALLEGRVQEAQRWLAQSRSIEEATTLFPDWQVESNSLRAKTLLAAGRVAEAAALFEQVIREAADIGFRLAMVDALSALAAVAAPGQPDQAARLLGMVDRVRAEARIVGWNPGEREETIANVRASLGADPFDRLHAEGHALSIPAMVEAVAGAGAQAGRSRSAGPT